MARIKILAVTENKEKWVQAATDLYEEKIGYFCKCEIIPLKPHKAARNATQEKVKKETDAILKRIDANDHVFLCDERGKSYSSVDFSRRLQKVAETSGGKSLVFVIGGAYGVGDELKSRAQDKIKLSEMTLNHYVAHTVLLEQIYRAFTIMKGLPYHNE